MLGVGRRFRGNEKPVGCANSEVFVRIGGVRPATLSYLTKLQP